MSTDTNLEEENKHLPDMAMPDSFGEEINDITDIAMPDDAAEIAKETVEPVVNAAPVQVNEEITDEKDTEDFKAPFSKLKTFDLDADSDFYVLLPNNTLKELTGVIKALSVNHETGAELYAEELSQEDSDSIRLAAMYRQKVLPFDVLQETIDNAKKLVNTIKYADKDLSPAPVTYKDKSGKISGIEAVARFMDRIGVGTYHSIPLWHSGIWVTIRPPELQDITNLQIAISDIKINMGRKTTGLVYSNWSVIIINIIVDFIISHIDVYNVKIPKADLRGLILIQDLNPMIAGILSAMFPSGHDTVRICSNFGVITENNKPMCSYKAIGKVSPIKTIIEDASKITPDMLEHMSNKGKDSVTRDQVIEYQRKLGYVLAKDVPLKDSADNEYIFSFAPPALELYIKNGNRWMLDIINSVEKMFMDADTVTLDGKNEKVNDLVYGMLMGVYNTFVVKITMDDTYIEDKETIDKVLNGLSGDSVLLNNFLNAVKEYINNNSICMVAVPSFKCPTCGAIEKDTITTGNFKNFTPINVLEYFFDLTELRLALTRTRSEEIY